MILDRDKKLTTIPFENLPALEPLRQQLKTLISAAPAKTGFTLALDHPVINVSST